jgi:ACS family hexuronate transporter-like MFS transporter
MNDIKIPGIRWIIVSLLFLATVICYVDRLTISILAPVIKNDLMLSNLQYASISTWFLISYSIMQAFFGRFYDKFGTRTGFSVAISVWSVAAAMHAAAKGILGFSFFRFLLGIGEAGNWPGVAKVIAEWFPVKQRAFGMSVVNCGAALGSVVAPPIIIWLQLNYGWKSAFIATGSAGFIWLVLWLIIYSPPGKHKWITNEEKELVSESISEIPSSIISEKETPDIGLLQLLRNRKVWGIIIARFFGDPIWWLYLVWLPLYLFEVKGFNLKQIGQFAWLPFLVSGIGSLAGGWFSGFLISKGFSVSKARYTAIIIATLFMPFGILSIYTNSAMQALFYMSLVLFGFQFWVNNVQTIPSDIFPNRMVASVAGLAQSGAGLGAVIFVMSTGWIVDVFSYSPVIIAAGIFGPIATISLIILTGKIEKSKSII